jgi:hypothetical protein
MSSNNYENNPSVSGSSCSYATLSHYNNGSQGMSPPVPSSTQSGSYIVPAYGSIGYNTLTYPGQTCSGYPTIGPAYKSNGGDCNQVYDTKLCQ